MAALKKGAKIECDFRDDEVELSDQDQVILEVKVCEKDQNKKVKLDWSVDEFIMGTDSSSGPPPTAVNPSATVEYTLCKNSQQIGSTVTSGHSIDLEFTNSSFPLNASFTQNNQPNFTFCDTPSLGMNCYQVKARKLDPSGTNTTSRAVVTDRSLNAIYIDKKK
ncbi:amphi-Trp domain-containing protein [Chengkuizengella sp. SCS-71B]|uniref:amphi-Trp domain-containing protein n=1 Tax=Chengkuizengella sp. SCS-71B TaxID=3115290 RepID=UPI0032C2118A